MSGRAATTMTRSSPSEPIRLMIVAGARPNFVKVAPLVRAADAVGFDVQLVHTGQHYDSALDADVRADLGLRAPDHHLSTGSGSHAEQVAAVMVGLEPLVRSWCPDWLVVVGDVNSTMASALIGAKAPCGVAHVEAGLRSGDWSMPEEVNRVVTDRVSDVLFAPSDDAVSNLVKEGIAPERIHLVGNVMADTLFRHLAEARRRDVARDLGVTGPFAVLTLHRPALVDDSERFSRLLCTLGEVAARIPVVFPVHPRTRAVLSQQRIPAGMRLVPPLGYIDFLSLEAAATLVLTDSGGVQEETTLLDVPCLTLRDTTERPVTTTVGTNRVVGLDRRRILEAVDEVIANGWSGSTPALWDGHAARRVVEVLAGQPASTPVSTL